LIAVEDEGPGIDPSLIPFIFDRFWRAPDARYEGAGLGLAICKEIATAHDWHIAVMRRARGTCFQLSYATCPSPVVTRPERILGK
jgi:signal transduction histidine kinase